MNRLSLAAALSVVLVGPVQADIILGPFNFNSQLFGDTLVQDDGGTWAAANWLNVVDADPGSPAYLTGANFNTGIANIGSGEPVLYSIGYGTPIVNVAGADLGIVTARFSTDDNIRMDVSSDGGATFQGSQVFGPGLAVATSVPCSYFYGPGNGPFACDLYVTPVDLSSFGLALGESINLAQIGGGPELDLIRVAGLGDPAAVPEPTTMLLLGGGLLGLAARRRRAV